MLIMFRTKNFNSFKDDVILDLRKTNYTQHIGHTFKCGNHDLLKTIAIYGANASGKSNLISAITKYRLFIINQLYIDKEELTGPQLSISANPFLLTDEIDKKMEFEMVFYSNGNLFQYGYSIEEKIIRSEWLYVNDEIVFDRTDESIEYGTKYKDMLEKYDKVKIDRLYIGVIDYFASDKTINDIMFNFKLFVLGKLRIYTNVFLDISVKGINTDWLENSRINDDDALRKKVVEYVKKIDVGIKDIILDKKFIITEQIGMDPKQLNINYAVHDVYNNNDQIVSNKRFDFNLESSGTIRFISIIEDVVLMLEEGGVFLVDELSARLHPVITKFIIDLFQSEVNEKNAQLIFTTHDVSQMNKDQFRRDEIVLVDKNEKGVSRIYALSNLDVRSDASFDKDYFKGKYGALPIVKDFYDSGVASDGKAKTKC